MLASTVGLSDCQDMGTSALAYTTTYLTSLILNDCHFSWCLVEVDCYSHKRMSMRDIVLGMLLIIASEESR